MQSQQPSIDGPGTAEEGKLHMDKTEIDSEPGGEFPNAMLYFRAAKEEASSDQIIGSEYVKDFDMGYSPDEDMEDIRYVCENGEYLADEQIYRDVESSEVFENLFACFSSLLAIMVWILSHISETLNCRKILNNFSIDQESIP